MLPRRALITHMARGYLGVSPLHHFCIIKICIIKLS